MVNRKPRFCLCLWHQKQSLCHRHQKRSFQPLVVLQQHWKVNAKLPKSVNSDLLVADTSCSPTQLDPPFPSGMNRCLTTQALLLLKALSKMGRSVVVCQEKLLELETFSSCRSRCLMTRSRAWSLSTSWRATKLRKSIRTNKSCNNWSRSKMLIPTWRKRLRTMVSLKQEDKFQLMQSMGVQKCLTTPCADRTC